jgi:hypothetical protein
MAINSTDYQRFMLRGITYVASSLLGSKRWLMGFVGRSNTCVYQTRLSTWWRSNSLEIRAAGTEVVGEVRRGVITVVVGIEEGDEVVREGGVEEG